MRYRLVIERTEVITFEVDADSPDQAEDRYLMDGDEVMSRTVETVVLSITAT